MMPKTCHFFFSVTDRAILTGQRLPCIVIGDEACEQFLDKSVTSLDIIEIGLELQTLRAF